jgi:8-oxo-dGTP pyrophosphatase MutT (NUDIX family)
LAQFVEQAGAVIFRRGDDGFRVLLVRARKNPSDWIFPKGTIEANETAAEAAVREAEEEAGVTGNVVSALWPALTFEAGGRSLRVQYFLVEFTGTTPAKESREVAWLPPSAAREQLAHAAAQTLLTTALENVPPGRRER